MIPAAFAVDRRVPLRRAVDGVRARQRVDDLARQRRAPGAGYFISYIACGKAAEVVDERRPLAP